MGNINRSEVDYWRSDDGLLLINAWARDGLILEEIAGKIGITRYMLSKWRQRYPEIAEALNTGKEIIDYKVENALLKSALGYQTKEVKVTLGKKNVNGEIFEVLKETTIREVGPNVTACLAWLNNRKFDQWKRNRDKVLQLDEEDQNINITIVRGTPKEDGIGDNVNQEVNFKKKEEENPLDAWPDDYEDEENEE